MSKSFSLLCISLLLIALSLQKVKKSDKTIPETYINKDGLESDYSIDVRDYFDFSDAKGPLKVKLSCFHCHKGDYTESVSFGQII